MGRAASESETRTVRLLLVDDDDAFRKPMAELLSLHGYDVSAAASGAEAIGLARAHDYDVVFTDMRMHGMSGLDLLREIKKVNPDATVIMLSGYADVDTAIDCMRAGAFDFLRKPVALGDIKAVIMRAVENQELRAAAASYEATRAILEVRDPHRLAEIIVNVAIQVMRADNVSLMLVGENDELYVAHSAALSNEIRATTRVAMGTGIAGRVLTHGEPVLIQQEASSDPRFADACPNVRVGSSIVYPLRTHERMVGVLAMSRFTGERPFHKRDLRLAMVLSSQVLLALENARLVREIVSSSRLLSLGQLAASVAHEINNPMAYVLSSQEYLDERLTALTDYLAPQGDGRTDGLVSQLREASAEIRDGAMRVRAIVHEIGSLARAEPTSETVFDVNLAIRSALRVAGSQLRHVASVEEKLEDNLLVRGNLARMSQVFVNLFVNAAQAFTRDSGNAVVVTSHRRDDQVVVRVADNGPGIEPEHLNRVFETFFTTKAATSGSGLGLAISREIVRRADGDIRVTSARGHGATFEVVLPAAQLAATAPSVPRVPTVERAPSMRMLFVDDEAHMLRSYERIFRGTNVVYLASTVTEAWNAICEHQDLNAIICDIQMREGGGIALYERVRAEMPHLLDAFVFVTGGPTTAAGEAFLASVPNPVVLKPFEQTQLKAIVERKRPRRPQS